MTIRVSMTIAAITAITDIRAITASTDIKANCIVNTAATVNREMNVVAHDYYDPHSQCNYYRYYGHYSNYGNNSQYIQNCNCCHNN